MNGYFAVQLDKQSCNAVKKLATKFMLVSDHVTLAYKPIKKVYDKYAKLVGKKVGVYVKGYRANDHIDALWVDDMVLLDSNKRLKRHNKGVLILHYLTRKVTNQVTLTLCLQTLK